MDGSGGTEAEGKGARCKEFVITREDLAKLVKRRKNWSAPGIDVIQNYWWKKFHGACDALRRAKVR